MTDEISPLSLPNCTLEQSLVLGIDKWQITWFVFTSFVVFHQPLLFKSM